MQLNVNGDAGGPQFPAVDSGNPNDPSDEALFSSSSSSSSTDSAEISGVSTSDGGANPPSSGTSSGRSGAIGPNGSLVLASKNGGGADPTSGTTGSGGLDAADPSAESDPAATGASATDGADTSPVDQAIDDSEYSSPEALAKWAPLVAGLPPDQQLAAEKALNRPLAAAEMLKAGGDEATKAQAYLDANPAVKSALDTAAHGGKADGNISKNDISSFISTMQKQLKAGSDTLSSYQKSNPNADDQSLQLVRDAALLQANLPITNAADKGEGDKANGMTTKAGLKAIASSNPGLSTVLTSAANLFSQPGMFAVLDNGGASGVSLATHAADGLFNEKNITQWVKDQAPTTGGQFATLISNAAVQSAVSGVDTSDLDGDIFTNPQNYTGAQKAAALVQLQNTQAQVEAGSSLRKVDDTDAELQDRISQLQADPDVVQFLQSSVPQSEASIVNSDPSLAAAVQNRYSQDIVTGNGLKEDLDRVSSDNAKNTDPKKAKESDASALNDFSSELALQSDLHGGAAPTLAQVVQSDSTLTNQLQSDYTKDFSNGGETKQLLSVKDAKATDVLSTVQSDEQSFEAALDPKFLQSQSDLYSSTTSALIQPALVKEGSSKDVLAGLSDGPAGLDEVSQSVAESLVQQGQSPLNQQDTQTVITSFLNDLHDGTSLQDALAKYDPTSNSYDPSAVGSQFSETLQSNPAAADEVHTMLINVASSALVMKSQGESVGDTADKALTYASYGLMGGEMSAAVASGYYRSQAAKAAADGNTDAADAASAKASYLSMTRDVLGGVGGGITAVLVLPSVAALIKAGQKWNAGLSVAAGTRGIYAATSTSVDLGILAAKRAGGQSASYSSGTVGRAVGIAVGRAVGAVAGQAAGIATAEAIGAAAGPVGWILDGVLGVAFIFTAIGEAVKKAHERKAFDKTVDPTLDQFGITKPK